YCLKGPVPRGCVTSERCHPASGSEEDFACCGINFDIKNTVRRQWTVLFGEIGNSFLTCGIKKPDAAVRAHPLAVSTIDSDGAHDVIAQEESVFENRFYGVIILIEEVSNPCIGTHPDVPVAVAGHFINTV